MKRKKQLSITVLAVAGLTLGALAGGMASSNSTAARSAVLAANQSVGFVINLDKCGILAQGRRGGCVSQLQAELNAYGNAGLTVDGTFGPATRQAVVAFQQGHGVTPADGVVGAVTEAALDAVSQQPPTSAGPGAAAPTTSASPTQPTPTQYVALGDSYSSGEGLYPFMGGSDTEANSCHRSDQAYSQYLAHKPADIFAACSGQTTAAIDHENTSDNEPPQDSRVGDSTGLITLTIGGNDLHWTSVLGACSKWQTALTHSTLLGDPDACNRQLAQMPGRISQMQQNLIRVYHDLLSKAPFAQIRVLDYPPVFPDRGGKTSGCRLMRIGLSQVVVAHDVEEQFVSFEKDANAAIAQAAEQVRTTTPGGDRLQLADVDAQFGGYTGHTFSCGDTGRPTPWINPIRLSTSSAALLALDAAGGNSDKLSSDLNDVYKASFHPTHEGQHEMYLALAPTLPSGFN
jgi:peptidoglycan hydrolase-like protein with peptidoglycan-binding domain